MIETLRTQREVIPAAGRERGPQPRAPLRRHPQEARALRRQQPLVRRRRVEVGRQRAQIHAHHARRVRPIHHTHNASPATQIDDRAHRHQQPRRERDVRDRNHACPGCECAPEDADDLVVGCGRDRNGQLAQYEVAPLRHELPWTQAANVLVVRRQDLIAILQLETVGDEVHPLRGVARKHETRGIGVHERAQPGFQRVPVDTGRIRHGDAAGVLDHGIDHGPWLRAQCAHVQIEPVCRDQKRVAHDVPHILRRSPGARACPAYRASAATRRWPWRWLPPPGTAADSRGVRETSRSAAGEYADRAG